MFNQYKLWKISAYSTKPVKNFIRGTSSKDAKKKIYILLYIRACLVKILLLFLKVIRMEEIFLSDILFFGPKKKNVTKQAFNCALITFSWVNYKPTQSKLLFHFYYYYFLFFWIECSLTFSKAMKLVTFSYSPCFCWARYWKEIYKGSNFKPHFVLD